MYFVTFILRNLTRRPVRTVLTVLGLAVAVGSMVALLGISHNVSRAVAESFERRGVDLVVIAGGVTDQLSSDLDQGLTDKIRQIPGVTGVDTAMLELIDQFKGQFEWPEEERTFLHLTLDHVTAEIERRLALGLPQK